MNLDILTFIQTQGVAFTFKVGMLVVLTLFILFQIVVVKQVRSMNTIITQPDLFPYLQSFIFFVLTVTVMLFLISLVIL